MKVLVIAQYFPPDMGGASARAFNAVRGLRKKGCRVTVVAAFPHYPDGKVPSLYRYKALVGENVENIPLLRVWIPAIPHNSVVKRVLLHLSFIASSLFALPFVGKIDVIWAANPNLFCFYSALVYGLIKKKPVVRNVDDLWPEVFYEMGLVRSRFLKPILDFLSKLSYIGPVAITPVSAGYKRRIMEKYGVRAAKIHVIEVGVNTVEPSHANKNDTKRFIAMYSGVLGVGYDFETVLKAAETLSHYENVTFLIRGIGELAPKLKRLIEELDLRNVVLDTSFLPKTKLSALLSSADVFLLPMNSASFVDEGLPAKVFEYQAYGKPIVCCSDGEPARYILSTKSGLVVKPCDSEALAQAILKLYKHRKLALKLGLNGQRHVSQNLTAEHIGERMYNVFQSTKKHSAKR